MTTQPTDSSLSPLFPTRFNILGLAFFLMGAPHIYGVLKQRRDRQIQSPLVRYAGLVVLALTLAGLVELSVLY
ncbi:MAG: hypothetical protein KGQ93_00575 [Cyanobacteria bacterium REEB459]|nr:hypothetical protein [Cyanobacteria bacterium REEB459]